MFDRAGAAKIAGDIQNGLKAMLTPTIFLFSAGVVQGLFLLLRLGALRSANLAARICLMIVVCAGTVMLYSELAERARWPFDAGFGMMIELALLPGIYLLVRALFEPEFRFQRQILVHTIPFAAGLIALFVSRVVLEDAMAPDVIAIWVVAKAIIASSYITGAWIAANRAASRASLLPHLRRAAQWGRWVVLAFGLAIAGLYVHVALFIAGLTVIDSDLNTGIILTILIFGTGWFLSINRKILQTPSRPTVEDADLWPRIERYLSAERPYLDQDFSLPHLARAMNTPQRLVSQAILERQPRGFSALVNQLRVEAFKAAVRDDPDQSMTILQLAFEAGFNSKPTFYRIFAAVEGVSPSVYRQAQNTGAEKT